ncbi:polysaccharide deacetylase [Luteibacter rhizovicinus]|uniref:Polysaccharide deacetylase n=1 Tax=Luteibacter rhizovicinus TaxID=242606 RepID=A0A4R3YY81_9GAMM|nr:polysaccharide deacetylase family protein [Luteibacter rhizovicinus]TCV97610.1 polysaccharide deacetylase [Luteibacter rhizovicinus]
MNRAALMYHDIVSPGDCDSSGFPGASAAHYKLDIDAFAVHLHELSTAGMSFGSVLAGAPHLLTFDDGGNSATQIGAMLDERGMTGHFFVTTSRIGTHGFLDASAIRILHAHGHVVGSHSHTHPAEISRLAPATLAREWTDSIDRLEQILGESVDTASIPGGFYSPDVARAAASAGVRYLFTSEPTTRTHVVDDCTILGRYAVLRDTSARHALALAIGTDARRERQWLAWNAKKPLKRWARPVYRFMRNALLERAR